MDSLINDAVIHSGQQLGYATIRQHQKDIMCNFLAGRDCLFVAPTGSGKSFIFEASPIALEYMSKQNCENKGHIALVVSPLVSLMRLQAQRLQERNISAAYLQVSSDIIIKSLMKEL